MRCPLLAVAVLASLVGACGRTDAPRFTADGVAPVAGDVHPVEIVQPPGLGFVDVDATDSQGMRAGIPCATCHAAGSGEALAKREDRPGSMHKDLSVQHGGLACRSCHDGDDPSSLVLADGEQIAMRDYMRLCRQCHGPQTRDFEHGSHGGMKGYWDLRRGPRQRNGCVGCHAAHAPAYPKVLPAAPPNDRFLEPKNQPGPAFEHRWSREAR